MADKPQVFLDRCGDIPLIYLLPVRQPRKRLVIFLSGFGAGKTKGQPYLELLSAAGFHALSFDPWQHEDRRIESQEELMARVHSNIRRHFWPILGRTIEEVPQVIDWAIDRFEIDPNRIGLGGISMGGDIAIAAAGIDRRIHVIGASLATPDWLRPGTKEKVGCPDEAAMEAFQRYNPMNHLRRYRHRPAIDLQCGAADPVTPPGSADYFMEIMMAYYGEEASRLRLQLHEGEHEMQDAMFANHLEWFIQHLR